MLPVTSRLKHFAAMALIGDGVMAIVHPKRDAKAWSQGPAVWRHLMQSLAARPGLTRLVGAAQIAGGVYWVLRAEKRG